MAAIFCLAAAVLLAAGFVSGSSWTYQDEKHWSEQCQVGQLQSPIALSLDIAREREFHHFRLVGYGQIAPAILKNNGHSAEVRLNITPNDRPEVSGGGLSGIYELDHLHFHWESEHTMDGNRYPLELHMVHYAKEYGSIPNAVQYPGGVAVFAVLFELSPDDDDEFEPLFQIIKTLTTRVGTPMPLSQFIVKNFLPRDIAGFYRYEGSLTTPNCNEGVIWTVFTNTIPISAKQVRIFQAMQTDDNTILEHNYRSLQALNDRDVYVKISPIRSGAEIPTTSSILLITLFALVLGFTKL